MSASKHELSLTQEWLNSVIDYDAKTGKFTWLVSPTNSVPAGKEAGTVRVTVPGGPPYRTIFIKGRTVSAGRLAWFMHYGEWPSTILRFNDGDTLNLSIKNLRLAEFPSIKETDANGKVTYKTDPEAARHYHLRNTFGVSLTEYAEMYAAQNGVCAICGQAEKMVRKGRLQPLAVDHCHAKGRIRSLLCHDCNVGLGSFKDNPDYLRKAAEYLELHCEEVAA